MVKLPDPTSVAEGYKLATVGVSAFTSRETVTTCCALLDGTPVAVIAILPEYPVELGVNPELFTETVSVMGAPGSTTPLVGETVIQTALCTAALNGTGPPVVVNTSVCAPGGLGGVAKFSVELLICSVGSAASTASATVTVNGVGFPAATARTCGAGGAEPSIQVNDNDDGVAVKAVVVVWANAVSASSARPGKRERVRSFTPASSSVRRRF